MLPQLFWLFHLWRTTIGLLAGFLICIIGGMSFVTKVTVVLCSGGYTGLILGFFGGILYLYRSESRHLTDSTTSQFSTTARKISLNAKTAARLINRTAFFIRELHPESSSERILLRRKEFRCWNVLRQTFRV